MNKSYLDRLIDAKWPHLPMDCELLWDTENSCGFQLTDKHGNPTSVMGISECVETFWRNADKYAEYIHED